MDVIALISTLIAGGLGGAVFTHFINRKSNRQLRELKKEEIRIRQEELRIQEERQRLEDLPKIMFGNLMQTSPLSGELKIELFNQGAECDIIEIDATGIKGRLLQPRLPYHFRENSNLNLEFRLPIGSEILTHTFLHYSIPLKIQDKHSRIYTCAFEVNNLGGTAGVKVTPLVMSTTEP